MQTVVINALSIMHLCLFTSILSGIGIKSGIGCMILDTLFSWEQSACVLVSFVFLLRRRECDLLWFFCCCFWVLVGIEIRFKEIWCWKAMAAHINDLKYLKLAKTNKSAFWSFLLLSEVFMQASLESRICLLFTVYPFLFLKMLLSIWKSWLFRF